ncbi:MAG TPA: hypothetical protein DCF63_15715 [Planctomycetaceae bacterium]|nr:hypothetical protein [Planctomycetaceae bacterium]
MPTEELFRLAEDPRKTKREFVIPLATVAGSIDYKVVAQAENQSQLFVDPSAYDFPPKPVGPLARNGVAIDGLATVSPGSPP